MIRRIGPFACAGSLTRLAFVLAATGCSHVQGSRAPVAESPEVADAVRLAVDVQGAARRVARADWPGVPIDSKDVVIMGRDWALQLDGPPYPGMRPLAGSVRCPCLTRARGPPDGMFYFAPWRWSSEAVLPDFTREDSQSNEAAQFLARGGWFPSVVPWRGTEPVTAALAEDLFTRAMEVSELDGTSSPGEQPVNESALALELKEQACLATALRTPQRERLATLASWNRVRRSLDATVRDVNRDDEAVRGIPDLFGFQVEAELGDVTWREVESRVAGALERGGRDLGGQGWFLFERKEVVGAALALLLHDGGGGGATGLRDLVAGRGNRGLDIMLADVLASPENQGQWSAVDFGCGTRHPLKTMRSVDPHELEAALQEASLQVAVRARHGIGWIMMGAVPEKVFTAVAAGQSFVSGDATIWTARSFVRTSGIARMNFRKFVVEDLFLEGPTAATVVTGLRGLDGRRGPVDFSTPQLEVHSNDAEVQFAPGVLRITLGPGLSAPRTAEGKSKD